MATKKKKKQRRKRIFWSTCEETHLRLGVREFGVGKWAKILKKYAPIFKNRTSVDLKDKWRNISKKNPNNSEVRKGIGSPSPFSATTRADSFAIPIAGPATMPPSGTTSQQALGPATSPLTSMPMMQTAPAFPTTQAAALVADATLRCGVGVSKPMDYVQSAKPKNVSDRQDLIVDLESRVMPTTGSKRATDTPTGTPKTADCSKG